MDTTRVKKLDLTEEIVNKTVKCILDRSLAESIGWSFYIDELGEAPLQRYLEEKMGDELRRYIKVSNCRKLSKNYEDQLNMRDLILVILRAILRNYGYCLANKRTYQGVGKGLKSIYWIEKNTEGS